MFQHTRPLGVVSLPLLGRGYNGSLIACTFSSIYVLQRGGFCRVRDLYVCDVDDLSTVSVVIGK